VDQESKDRKGSLIVKSNEFWMLAGNGIGKEVV